MARSAGLLQKSRAGFLQGAPICISLRQSGRGQTAPSFNRPCPVYSASKWLAVLGSVPVVGTVFSVLGSAAALFERDGKNPIGPFAYAGYARAVLLD